MIRGLKLFELPPKSPIAPVWHSRTTSAKRGTAFPGGAKNIQFLGRAGRTKKRHDDNGRHQEFDQEVRSPLGS